MATIPIAELQTLFASPHLIFFFCPRILPRTHCISLLFLFILFQSELLRWFWHSDSGTSPWETLVYEFILGDSKMLRNWDPGCWWRGETGDIQERRCFRGPGPNVARACLCARVCADTRMCVHMHVHMSACACVCKCMSAASCLGACAFVGICVHVCVFPCV